jgi:hypothetical protein
MRHDDDIELEPALQPSPPGRSRVAPFGIAAALVGALLLLGVGFAVNHSPMAGAEMLAGADERRAIDMVRKAPCPTANPWLASTDGTCGSSAEVKARRNNGSSEGYTWRTFRDYPGLLADEWVVAYLNTEERGYFYVVDLGTGRVIDLLEDLFVAARVGHLHETSNPTLRMDNLEAALVRCSDRSRRGWCFEVKGKATNTGAPLINLTVNTRVMLRLGERTHEGEGWPNQPDPFRDTSTNHPWPAGETRSFHYRSKVLQDILGTERGEVLGIMEVGVETVSQGTTREYVVVRRMPWEPDSLPR